MNEHRSHALVRVLKAATVLAAWYTLGVGVLLALVTVLGVLFIDDLWRMAGPFAILFGIALIVLAAARRIGFVLLWLVLVSLWVAMLFAGGISDGFTLLSRGIAFPSAFMLWSVLALPLFVISATTNGPGTLLRIGPWAASPFATIGVVWVLLVIGGAILRDYAHPHFPWVSMSSAIALATLGWILWAPMPFVIAAVSVRRFWIGSRSNELADSAA